MFTRFHMSEEDVITFIKQPFVAACTDGRIPGRREGKRFIPDPTALLPGGLHRYVNTLGSSSISAFAVPHRNGTASGDHRASG